MKIVFTDLDGPVCNRRTHMATASRVGAVWQEADPVAIQFFNRLYMTDPAHTRFVICSDWRIRKPEHEIKKFLNDAGWIGKFHDDWKTPIRNNDLKKGHGYDIDAWLDNHADVTSWVSVDDSELGYRNTRRLVKADGENGLTLDMMHDAFLILHRMNMLDAAPLWQKNYAENNFG